MADRIIPGKHTLGLLVAGCLWNSPALKAQYLITSPNYTYTQDFGTSVISASGTNLTSSSANLTGWSYDVALTSEINITAAAPTNTGGRYAYTLNGANNRKIGSRPSGGTGNVEYGILFQNTSGQTIQSFSLSYTGYQLSTGGNTSTDVNKLTVDYIISTSSIAVTAGGGTSMPSLDFSQSQFVSSSNTSSQGAGYPSTIGSAINSGCVSLAVNIPNNSYLLLRWKDIDDPQNDPHLAIDDVEVIFFTNQTVSNNVACSLLPLNLLDFYVTGNELQATLSWRASGDEQVDAYAVEKSTNGTDYAELGRVSLQGDPGEVHTYHLQDRPADEELSYYRLWAVEKNGNRHLCKLIVFDPEQEDVWSCQGYCRGEELVVDFSGRIPLGAVIGVYDLSGKRLLQTPVRQASQVIDLGNFDAGLYSIVIESSTKTVHFKIPFNHL